MDDPALFVIQVSRRLPFGARIVVGQALEKVGNVVPSLGALGSVMAGQEKNAERGVERAVSRAGLPTSRLASEVAILLDRSDLVSDSAPAATRARAAWSRGAISEALGILEDAGEQNSRYASRLRSEAQLLQPGYSLPMPPAMSRPMPPLRRTGEPLRVLHLLTNSLPHTQSGYSLRSHRILTALRDQGIESVALTRTGYPVMVGIPTARDEDVVDGIRYARTLPDRLPQTQQERLEAEVRRTLKLVEEFRPHVLHTTTNYQNALVAQAVSTATGLPWVYEVRGLMEETWVASHKSETSRTQAASSERYDLIAAKEVEQARDSDAVVTLSNTMAGVITRRGLSGRDIVLVPNGIDDTLLHGHLSTYDARTMIGLEALPSFGANAFLVGAVSALVDYEGYDVLLRAVAHLVTDESAPSALRFRIAVVLAGDGVARPGLLALAEELGIENRVHMPGRVPRSEARRWVEALDVVAVPRLDVEVARTVTPQKPVEALALGRPLIISDLPALREVVTDPGGVALAECATPADSRSLARAIVSVYEAGPPNDDHTARGRNMARQRLWPELVGRYREIYGKAVVTSSGGKRNGD
ncbi:glycosyltransferase family 4 protein [Brachybacterium alimentarium]|uniref:glycosyltransferase family 4 protein n=1 Tax=Brachybacterium alimentarium TaxID=47845 RepID=UPI003FD50801